MITAQRLGKHRLAFTTSGGRWSRRRMIDSSLSKLACSPNTCLGVAWCVEEQATDRYQKKIEEQKNEGGTREVERRADARTTIRGTLSLVWAATSRRQASWQLGTPRDDARRTSCRRLATVQILHAFAPLSLSLFLAPSFSFFSCFRFLSICVRRRGLLEITRSVCKSKFGEFLFSKVSYLKSVLCRKYRVLSERKYRVFSL